jgi:hypothetical protein
MYSWLWRKLPGGRLLKSIQCLALVALFIAACYFWFFPWLDALLFTEVAPL